MLLTTLLLSCWLPLSSAYQGSVVDAKTRQPIPAATVQLLKGSGGQVTGAAERFTLAGLVDPTIHLRMSSLGYAPVEMTRFLQVGPDTIRLTAVAQALPSVEVRPRQVETLQPFVKTPRILKGYYLLPSSDFAAALPPVRPACC